MRYHIEKSSRFSILHTRGEITLQPDGGRTKVTWISEGRMQVPVLDQL